MTRGTNLESFYCSWYKSWVFPLFAVQFSSFSITLGTTPVRNHLCQRGPRRRFVRKVRLSIARGTNIESFYHLRSRCWFFLIFACKSWVLSSLLVENPFEIVVVSADSDVAWFQQRVVLLFVGTDIGFFDFCSTNIESFYCDSLHKLKFYLFLLRGPRRCLVRKVIPSTTRGMNFESFYYSRYKFESLYYSWCRYWVFRLLVVRIVFVIADRETAAFETWALSPSCCPPWTLNGRAVKSILFSDTQSLTDITARCRGSHSPSDRLGTLHPDTGCM